jgi:hypothetical protein
MYNLEFRKIYTDRKFCLCGCRNVIQEENWGLRIFLDGKITSIEEVLEIIEKFEFEVKDLSAKTIVCKYCGHCCLHGPELSEKELEYLSANYPEYREDYMQIISGKPCQFGGENTGPCKFPENARPFQCRILYCEANIVGFESMYNFLGGFLGWTSLN